MSKSSKGTSSGKGIDDRALSNSRQTANIPAKSRLGIGWCIIFAAMLLIVPAIGFAQEDRGPEGRPDIADIDEDGDGRISEDEFTGPDEHFSELDKNDDGYIDADEAPAGPPEGDRGGFERDDQDDDGRVSEDEFSGPSDHFDELDQDDDGYIDEDEASQGPRGGGRGGRGGGPRS